MWDKAAKWLIENSLMYAAQKWDERSNNKAEAKRLGKFVCKYCGAVYRSLDSMKVTKCSKHPDGFR